MRNLSLKHIETVQAIAAAGSLVGAAATLNLTPAALTARVKALEDAVELKLFDRLSTGLRLTKAGEAALEASRVVERAVHDFTEAMLAISAGEGGRLSVGAVSTAKYFAPRLIAAFLATRPKVDLRFQIGNRDATVEFAAQRRNRDRARRASAARNGGRDLCLRPAPLCADRSAGASLRWRTGIDPSRSCRGSVPVQGDRLRHAIAIRRLYRRHQHQARSDAHGAWVERVHQTGGDGGNRNRAHFGSHHRRGGCRRKACLPGGQRLADPSPLVCGQPDRQSAFAGRKRLSRFCRKPGAKIFASGGRPKPEGVGLICR